MLNMNISGLETTAKLQVILINTFILLKRSRNIYVACGRFDSIKSVTIKQSDQNTHRQSDPYKLTSQVEGT